MEDFHNPQRRSSHFILGSTTLTHRSSPLTFRTHAYAAVRSVTAFFGHVASIVYSCLTDVNKGNWLAVFLTGLNEDEKANWAGQLDSILSNAPESRKTLLWHRWMKDYWIDRLNGIPCPLMPKEAEEMLKWAFSVGESFPEAVDLVIRCHIVKQRLGIVLHLLKKHEAPEKYPESVLRLLHWLLKDRGGHGMVSNDIESVLFRFPKKKAFLTLLNSICQHLASLGYEGATNLKHRIENEFTEE